MAEKYIKTKSSYTFRKPHKKIDGGTIFERDFMTISGSKGFAPDERALYNESNFRFVVRNGSGIRKKHGRGNWLINTCDGSFEWTEECLPASKSTDNKLRLNPNYESIRDFAYYGSAMNLIRASIVNIINHFPAELYFSDDTYYYNNIEYFVVENDFNIDIVTDTIGNISTENDLRFLCLSSVLYDYIDASGNKSDLQWSVNIDRSKTCISKEGTIIGTVSINGITITVLRYPEGDILLYTAESAINSKVRPKEAAVTMQYEKFNDFEKILASQDTTPLYKAVFKTPYHNDDGFFTSKRSYIWPNKHDWNLDITSNAYSIYIASLTKLAEFHDEYDCDNIWRMMTHEAIKNLDWTLIRNSDTSDEMDSIDNSRIEPILKIYGRQYDDIKRYIDNIKYINNVTYNKQSNIPDSMLAASLRLSGWDVKTLSPSFGENQKVGVQFPGKTLQCDAVDTNNEFYRALKVNSRRLLSLKGTAKGVEEILSLMGFRRCRYVDITYKKIATTYKTVTSVPQYPDYTDDKYIIDLTTGRKYMLTGDYTLSEKIAIAKRNSYPNGEDVLNFNQKIREEEGAGTRGLPVAIVTLNDEISYAIPWYEKEKSYSGDFYFQKYGGWHKKSEKRCINPLTNEEYEDFLKTDKNLTVFESTVSSMRYLRSVGDLFQIDKNTIESGDICYVTDLSDFTSHFGEFPETTGSVSHYFAIWDKDFWYTPYSESYKGWVYINASNIEPDPIITEDPQTSIAAFRALSGKKVVYLENQIFNTEGNNPHAANKEYDLGKSYVDDMLCPFKESLEYNEYAKYLTEEEKAEIIEKTSWEKLDVTGYTTDNKKCWYFYNEHRTKEHKPWIVEGETIDIPYSVDIDTVVPSQEGTGLTKSDESAANSVINIKNTILTFYIYDEQTMHPVRRYVQDRVMYYVTQMLPSSVIFECNIVDLGGRKEAEPMDDTNLLQETLKNIDGVIYGTLGCEYDMVDGADFSENVRVISVK